MTLEVTMADREAAAAYYAVMDNGKGTRATNARLGNMDDLPTVQAFAAHRQAAERKVVEWLREENGLCDCHARSEGECGCGAWQDYKTKPLIDIADAIERGEHRK